MLKRQRSITSFTPDVYVPQESTFDISERLAKRRRPLEPLQFFALKGKAPWKAGDSDGDDDEEQNRSYSTPSEYARRLEHAGEYKNVNSLLHDLHAEQRHRTLFSSTSPLSHNPLPLPSYAFPSADRSLIYSPNKSISAAPAEGPLSAPHTHSTSFTVSISAKEDASEVDHVEVQRVTQQYEDTNRFLGALFLSRRKQNDDQET